MPPMSVQTSDARLSQPTLRMQQAPAHMLGKQSVPSPRYVSPAARHSSSHASRQETPSQQALLEAFGCKEGQGYLFARPMPASDFQAFVDQFTKTEKIAPAPAPSPLDHKAFRMREMADTFG